MQALKSLGAILLAGLLTVVAIAGGLAFSLLSSILSIAFIVAIVFLIIWFLVKAVMADADDDEAPG